MRSPDVLRTELVPDYRFHRVPPSAVELKVLEGVQRWAEEQRLNLLDLYDMLGEAPPGFPTELYATVASDAEVVATRARAVAEFPLERQTALNSNDKRLLPEVVRRALERCGVLVLRAQPKIKLSDFSCL